MRIEFQPISSISDVAEWHAIVELLALYYGSCAIDELEWDEDELLRSLIEETDDVSLRADYEAEPQMGIQIAKDRFISDLSELINERQSLLGQHSPFNKGGDGSLLLVRKAIAVTSGAALAYVWLAFFWVVSSPKDYLIISKADREYFMRLFALTFEYICCLVMAARSPTAVWYFGDSRNVSEFLRRLSGVVASAGTGAVKEMGQLQVNQTGANDAGVDVMAIETRNGAIRRDSIAYLVGATIQKSDRRNKIIGIDQIRRFTDYFDRGPELAYNGVLAIPFPAAPAEALNCRDKNCLYITKEEILQTLAQYPDDPARLNYIRSPRRKLIRKSREMQNVSTLVGRTGDARISWA